MTMTDLSQLPAPSVVESLDYESIYQAMLADLRRLCPDWTADLESDPAVKLLEVAAYMNVLLRARVNDAARAVMLAYADGSDLVHLAALFGVSRLEGEMDDRLRMRVQMAPEGFSTAGPELAYAAHVLSVSNEVKDVTVSAPRFDSVAVSDAVRALLPDNAMVLVCTDSAGLDHPVPGMVKVVALAVPSETNPHGMPCHRLREQIEIALSDDNVRPLTDIPVLVMPDIRLYTIRADLYIASGPDAEVTRQRALASLQTFVDQQFGLGKSVTVSALHAALHQQNVLRVELIDPSTNILLAPHQAAHCTGFEIRIAGVES